MSEKRYLLIECDRDGNIIGSSPYEAWMTEREREFRCFDKEKGIYVYMGMYCIQSFSEPPRHTKVDPWHNHESDQYGCPPQHQKQALARMAAHGITNVKFNKRNGKLIMQSRDTKNRLLAMHGYVDYEGGMSKDSPKRR